VGTSGRDSGNPDGVEQRTARPQISTLMMPNS
jgi:hypothetical protein